MTDPRYPLGKFEWKGSLTEDERLWSIAIISHTPDEMRAAVEGLDDEQFDTPYREGGWTARQITEAIAMQNQFITTLDRVISVADSYPQLRAGQEYSMVLEQFRSFEGRASLERRKYNDAAAEFNQKLRSFPGNLVSQVSHVSDRSFLKAPGQLAHSMQPVRG